MKKIALELISYLVIMSLTTAFFIYTEIVGLVNWTDTPLSADQN